MAEEKKPNVIDELADSIYRAQQELRAKNVNHPLLKEVYVDRNGIHADRVFYRSFKGVSSPIGALRGYLKEVQDAAK